MRRSVRALLSLVMVAVMLAGCDGQSSERPAENGASRQTAQASVGEEDRTGNEGRKVVTYTMQKKPETLNPTMNNYATSSVVLQNLFTGLMQISPNGGLINGCAGKYEVNGDGLEYTFTLRDGFKWLNGSSLMASDSECTWKYTLAQDTASPGAWYLFYLKSGEAYNKEKTSAEDMGVKTGDDRTLRITLENPTAYSIDPAVVTAYFPVKKDAVEGPEAWTKSADTYTSNGAFRLKGINPQVSYVLEKNPEYINADTVKLDDASVVFIESAEATLSAYNAGEVDVVDNTIIQTQTQSQYGGSDELKSCDLVGTCYYDFNCEKGYLSGARVRRALAMFLNRGIINQSTVASGPESFYASVPRGIPCEGSSEDYHTTMDNPFTEDVEAAKALMEEAGYPGGEGYPTLTLITQNDQERKGVTQVMQAIWKENLGVGMETVTLEPKVYWDEQTTGNFDICYDGWTDGYPDPSTNLDCFLLQRNETQCRWLNDQVKEYDSMMKEARSLTDNRKHMGLFETSEEPLMEEMPILPLYYRNAQLLVRPGCEGVIRTYTGHMVLRCVDKQ